MRPPAGVSLLILAATPGGLLAQRVPLPTIVPRAGMVIPRSARVAPGTYRLPAPESLDSAVLTVRGDSITLDVAGATLLGADPAADPDRAAGVGIRIEGGGDVRLLHAVMRGYKVGVLARGTRGLTLSDNDLSYGWKPRLYSVVEHEDRKSTRLNSQSLAYLVCRLLLEKKIIDDGKFPCGPWRILFSNHRCHH